MTVTIDNNLLGKRKNNMGLLVLFKFITINLPNVRTEVPRKQCRPRSDCSYGSSLIKVRTVFHSANHFSTHIVNLLIIFCYSNFALSYMRKHIPFC